MTQETPEDPATDTNRDGVINESDVVGYGEPPSPPESGSYPSLPEAEESYGDPPPPSG